jgi:hypothetical protein
MRAGNRCRLVAIGAVACGSVLCCSQSVRAQSSDLRAKYTALRDDRQDAPDETDSPAAGVPAYIPVQSESATWFERSARRAMQRQITAGFSETPLRDAAQALSRELRLPIFLDDKALSEASITPETTVKLARQTAPAKAIFKALLDPLDLNWIVEDGRIVLTTQAIAKERIVTRIYPVRDLITGIDESGNESYDFDSLIELITSTVSPTTWTESGGAGGITPFAQLMVLVIPQTREVHEQIEDLLAALRTARRVQHLPEIPRFQSQAFNPFDPTAFGTRPALPQTVRRTANSSTIPAWRIPHTDDGRPMATLPSSSGAGGVGGGGAF